jgi:hypothetical protein
MVTPAILSGGRVGLGGLSSPYRDHIMKFHMYVLLLVRVIAGFDTPRDEHAGLLNQQVF